MVALAEHRGERGVEPVDVLAVRHARAAPRGRRRTSPRRRGRAARASRSPGAAVQTARGDSAGGEVLEEAPAVLVVGPGAVGRRPRSTSASAPARTAPSRWWRGAAGPRAGARRTRAPAYRSASVALSAATCGAEHRLGADHPAQRRRAGRCGRCRRARSTTKPSTSWPANRTLTRAPGHRGRRHRRRDGVVERPVEVGQRRRRPGPARPGRSRRARASAALRRRVAAALALRAVDGTRAARGAARRLSRASLGRSWAHVYQRRRRSGPAQWPGHPRGALADVSVKAIPGQPGIRRRRRP